MGEWGWQTISHNHQAIINKFKNPGPYGLSLRRKHRTTNQHISTTTGLDGQKLSSYPTFSAGSLTQVGQKMYGASPNGLLEGITILQCNIGGKPASRLAKGGTLDKHILKHKPIVIALTETRRKRKDIPEIKGYSMFTLDPPQGSSGGIVVYFNNSLSFRTSKVFVSTEHNIIWVLLQHHETSTNDLYLCVVYAPQAYSTTSIKSAFYDELNGTTAKFQEKPGHRIIVGDFNARLGSVTGDHSFNSNQKVFTEYINNRALRNINVIKAYGQYTFHNITTGDRSIIDYLLTDMSPPNILEHEVLDGALGTSAQTAHKALLSKVLITSKSTGCRNQCSRPKWRDVNESNRERYQENLNTELESMSTFNKARNYKNILASLNRAKTKSLGRMRRRPPWATDFTPEIDLLHVAHGMALKAYTNNPSPDNLNKASAVEKTLNLAIEKFEKDSLLRLLDRLESYHQITKMREFYRVIKRKTTPQADLSLVIWDHNSGRGNPSFSANKEDYLEHWASYLELKFAKSMNTNFSNHLNFNLISDNSQDRLITKKEVQFAILSLKNLKAPGIDEITNEDIKLIQNLKPGVILDCLQEVWIKEKIPKEFSHSLINLFPKPSKPGNKKDLRYQENSAPSRY